MFSLKILDGDREPLHDPYSIVLTDETAHVLFGNDNPVGKAMKLDNSTILKVTAVVEEAAQEQFAQLRLSDPVSTSGKDLSLGQAISCEQLGK